MAYRPPPPDAFLEQPRGDFGADDELFERKIVLPQEARRANAAHYIDVYGYDRVMEDKVEVERIRKEVGPTPPGSKRLEYMTADFIGRRGVLGPDTEATLTDDLDDVQQGIDMVVRIRRPGQSDLYLAVDATASDEREELQRKIRRTANDVRNGKMPRVKYFETPERPPQEGVLELPRVVLGTDGKNAEDLFRQYGLGLRDPSRMAQLGRHPFRQDIMLELEGQLAMNTEIALKAFFRAASDMVTAKKTRLPSALRRLYALQFQLDPLQPAAMLASPLWQELQTEVEQHRKLLTAVLPDRTQNLLLHLDVIAEIEQRRQTKLPADLGTGGGRNMTARILSIPDKREYDPANFIRAAGGY